MTPLALRPLLSWDPLHPAFVAALAASRLPADDLDADARFFALVSEDGPLAFGGLEGTGADWLLRSVVVPEDRRRQGHGRMIVAALADKAQRDGAERLWLLTTSAASFFAALGWQAADRTMAPATKRASRQFRHLCPSSAVLMCRTPA